MIRVSNLKLHPNEKKGSLLLKACKKLRLDPSSVQSWAIVKESLDARDKKNIFFIYTVELETPREEKILNANRSKDVSRAKKISYQLPEGKADSDVRPVVVGFGPGGMFAALTLCQMGFRPIVLERGKDVTTRQADVERFWATGQLQTESNVQFGEGGAGAFSDGKLTSRSKDLRGKKVFDELIHHGAPPEISYVHNPHIGTDKLVDVVKNIREDIKRMGGEIRFSSCVTDIEIKSGKVTGITVNGSEKISTDCVILALGHSARDTYEMLYEKGIKLSQKPFAVGARIEHRQKDIDFAQFGQFCGTASLGPAEYKLTSSEDGRGAYTFCMCPGGYVVAAASEAGRVAVNGMSHHARDGENANSALLVQVEPEDLNSSHPLAGMYFQRELERKAFEMGGGNYYAPCQRVEAFLENMEADNKSDILLSGEQAVQTANIPLSGAQAVQTANIPLSGEQVVKTTSLSLEVENEASGNILRPTYRPGVTSADLNQLFPPFISQTMKSAVRQMGRRLKGFDENALLTAVESRSSAPVRIERNRETFESVSTQGLYPIGEGAGYAGGIVSAAIDGIWAAEKIFAKYHKA